MRNNLPMFRANGTIAPAVFVKVDTSADNMLIQATAGSGSHGDSNVIGISQVGQKRTPGLAGSDTTVAANQGDVIQIFGLGDVCLLTAGSGGWTAGQLLKSDANGNGVVATAGSGDFAMALAIQAASASGVQALVQIINRPA